MNYHNILHEDMVNGDGLRVVLFVSGCSHQCKGCQNPQTWNECSGIKFDESAMQEIYDQLDKDYINGITFSGGDPLYINNRDTIEKIIYDIRNKYGNNKTIWLYTGYNWDTIKDIPFIKEIDVIVDNKFDINLLDNNLKWRGSSNQNVIDVKKSLECNKLVLYCD